MLTVSIQIIIIYFVLIKMNLFSWYLTGFSVSTLIIVIFYIIALFNEKAKNNFTTVFCNVL